ncbi:CRISPR-associated protein Csx20 [Desulfurispira natronophila]|uniref:CRISPR-associated protein n=1 Tax=Desulfurispira natronophila TaxID=682562 RepID=A0A7W7Y5F6_9BACT|nr:CRISPR-associated protein Csx20 [Desulfurispira natronophila]MBB5022254.1 hypothetical protein [Desulfurispira natronophila]
MKSLFLIFSHRLTAEQEQDARENLGITHFVPLPSELQELWSNLPPEPDEIHPLLQPIKQWVARHAVSGDIALVTGDFGATWNMVNFCHSLGIIAVYATSRRMVIEERGAQGTTIKRSIFDHVRFRTFR